MSLLLCVVVHSAKRSDKKGMTLLALWFAFLWQSLQLIWTDSTFGVKVFTAWIKETFGETLEVRQEKKGQKSFEVLPKRWVVERTFAWFGRYRRLSKDYEICLPLVRQSFMLLWSISCSEGLLQYHTTAHHYFFYRFNIFIF